MQDVSTSGARKVSLSRKQKLMRLLRSTFDPRAWAHLVKLVNYYNYSHVQPLRVIDLGPNPNISPDAVFSHPERISIGAHARIGSRCHIWAGPRDAKVIIGDNLLLGPEVMITAASYLYNEGSPVTEQPMKEADVVIGDDVWLATRAVVLAGTTIGDGAIIAAHSVVKGEVPPYAIMAGAPARQVGTRTEPS